MENIDNDRRYIGDKKNSTGYYKNAFAKVISVQTKSKYARDSMQSLKTIIKRILPRICYTIDALFNHELSLTLVVRARE